MPKLKLKTVFRTQGNNQALKEGIIKSQSFEFEFLEVDPLIDAFRRMVRTSEFDICEMAITTYICARAHGKRITALPIFLMRAFHHGAIICNTKSGIVSPRDLEGKRVGVNRGYTVTTGLWARYILQHQYGVDLNKVNWVISGDEHVLEYRPPSNVSSLDKKEKLADMVTSGELVAAIGVEVDHPDVKPLIPNADAAAFKALTERGHYPINHTVVVRDELLSYHPELAADIVDAFTKAKDLYVKRLISQSIDRPTKVDEMYKQVINITGRDPLPYGVTPNRQILEQIVQAAVEQKIIDKSIALEDLFANGMCRS